MTKIWFIERASIARLAIEKTLTQKIPTMAVLLSLALAPTAAATSLAAPGLDNQILVRATQEDLEDLVGRYGLTIVHAVERNAATLALLECPAATPRQHLISLLSTEPAVQEIEAATLAALPDAQSTSTSVPNKSEILPDVLRSGEFSGTCSDGPPLWAGYSDQRAAHVVRLHEAHQQSPDCGAVTVAVIDTGVDPEHLALEGALVAGYDFLLDQEGIASEWAGLEHSVSAILEHSVSAILEETQIAVLSGQSDMASLAGSMAPLLQTASLGTLEEQGIPGFFGHGTMVAGLVRLVAPAAQIMPLRVFGADGQAEIYDIIQAIYYAVDNGADVINMSFSLDSHSPALRRAIRYARRKGVVCVAAAGNQGQYNARAFPALFPEAVGVASTDLNDQLSEFSNSGFPLVMLSAPGHGVISTYPGSLFAAGWGTSFSAPLVSGAVALIHHRYPKRRAFDNLKMIRSLRWGSTWIPDLAGQIGYGRLDLPNTLEAAE